MQATLRRVRRALLFGVVAFFALILLLVGTIKVETYIRRYQSEQLLPDILAIKLRRTTFEHAESISDRWHGKAEMPCSRQHCDMRIALYPAILPNPKFLAFHPRISQLALGIYRLLGGRPSMTAANINIRNGFVWGEFYGIAVETTMYENKVRHDVWLEGNIQSPGRRPYSLDFNDVRKAAHPEYSFGGTIRCPDCEMWVGFTPYADESDIRRLAKFNFSCMTRLRPCRTNQDLMPVATSQSREEYTGPDVYRSLKCDLKGTALVARESESAAIAEVVGNHASPEMRSDSRILRLRLLEALKGASGVPAS
jgi:hypothetical protein